MKEKDLGRELDKVVENFRNNYGEEFGRVSRDVWNILVDKAENEAYDKIKKIPIGHGLVTHGAL